MDLVSRRLGLPLTLLGLLVLGGPLHGQTEGAVETTGDLRQGYLYIEPYQTRFEVLFGMPLALKWLSMEGLAFAPLDEAAQKRITDRARVLATDWCEIQATSMPAQGRLVDVVIVKGRPKATLPMNEGEAIETKQAMLGFMWEFQTPPAPETISLRWKGFIPGAEDLPVGVSFGTKSEEMFLTRNLPIAKWENNGRLPRPAPLAQVPSFESTKPVQVPFGLLVWLTGGLLFYIAIKRADYKLPGGSTAYFFVWLLGAAMMSRLLILPVGGGSTAPEINTTADAEAILEPLLRNTYRAFDHRNESDIYDVLARSVNGELLRELYLETMRALTLEGREGTRTQVTDFEVRVDSVAPGPGGEGFVADSEWTALAKISHWGHPHTRVNRYKARVTVLPVKGEWKIDTIQLLEAPRRI